MKSSNSISKSLIVFSFIGSVAIAAPNDQLMFGAAAPFTIDKLPISRLRNRLENLPPPAQQRALKWLHSFDFPAEDVDTLNVDDHGAVFYQETVLPPEQVTQDELENDPGSAGIAPTDAFNLHSKPGAPNVVYLNFEGHTISGTAWNTSSGVAVYEAQAFDNDGDPNSFSVAERTVIAEVWHRFSEDFAPFNIDVTTEKPAAFGPNVGHVLITRNVDANGVDMPYKSAGGVAYVNVWGRSYYETYQPALVYFNRLSSNATYIAEASSHEFGHNQGLSHDGTLSGTTYYSGQGSGYTSWAPIMGNSYSNNISQWSLGEYPDANNTQDDMAILAYNLQYRNDDHANSSANATPLTIDANGHIASSNPEFDPLNQRPDNKGIIETRDDVDTFVFDIAAGQVDISINPAWDAFYRSSRRGANLDIQAVLYDNNGSVVASSDPTADTFASFNINLSAGRYFLEIKGVGNAITPYSDYDSAGQYFIFGTVPTASTDNTPPNPDPLTFANTPTANSRSSISMTTEIASDESGFVEYQFICSNGGTGCNPSAWQTARQFTAQGLQAGVEYSFQVKARDLAGNETAFSVAASATTLTNQLPLAQDDFAETDQNNSVSIAVLSNDSDPDVDNLFIYATTTPTNGDANIDGNVILYTPDADFTGTDSFEYTIADGFGGYATALVTIEVIAGNQTPIALDDTAEVLIGGSVVIDVLANDNDPEGAPITVISAGNGGKGTTAINADGSISYTTSGNKRGGDSFSYTISDGQLTSSAIVDISIVRSLSDTNDGGGDSGGGKTKCHPKRGC